MFRRVAVAEAITWALLLFGMVLKYGTGTTDLGVRVFGMLHGIVFIAYCLVTLLVGVDQRWSRGRVLLGLACSIPPFATVLFDRYAESRGALDERWRLRSAAPASQPVSQPVSQPASLAERAAAWLLRNPARGAVAGLVAVAVLTGVALVAGPPAG
nr:DUF3817 domain-containing protein [Nocardioides panaciterrulae]